MRVAAGAGLKFQGLRCLIEGPNPSKGNVQVPQDQFSALLEHGLKLGPGIERHSHLRVEGRHADAIVERFLGADALLDFPVQLAIGLMQRLLGALALRNVSDERLDDLASTPLNSGQGHFQRHLAPCGVQHIHSKRALPLAMHS